MDQTAQTVFKVFGVQMVLVVRQAKLVFRASKVFKVQMDL